MKKDVIISIDTDTWNQKAIDKVVKILSLIPADIEKSDRGKIEIDWSDSNIIYKTSFYKTVT